jgi:tRNA(His) 5'-end guanylyltransferase
MNDTAKYLCNNIQNAKFAYVQSDEISILLYPSDIKSQYWYDNNLNKIVSVSAALASACFTNLSGKIFNGVAKIATFDSRAFVLPLFEVENYFIWRQSDALRNSVSTLARSLFSHKQCLNKNSDELKKMCKDVLPWENMSNSFKRGRVILKTESSKESLNPKTKEKIVAIRKEWSVDNEIPIFSEYKEYIRDFLK